MAFSDITGQEQALNILKKALSGGRLAHSLLFTGPEGTGKRMAALGLAMELNCASPERGQACGACPECSQISKSAHPDVSIIAPEGKALEIKIEAVRGMRREIHLKPVRGRYKVFILEKADRLNPESSNALLKVLEEPPDQSLIILLTAEPYSLLPTIISRCQEVRFRRLSTEDTEKVLEKQPDIPREKIRLLARLSGGSPGKAVTMLKNGLERRQEIFDWAFPGEKAPENAGIFQVLASGGEKAGLEAKDTAQKRENLKVFFEMLLSWYRDALTAAAGGEDLVNEDFAERIKKYAASMEAGAAAEAMKTLLAAQEQVSLFANPRLVFEAAMTGIAGNDRR